MGTAVISVCICTYKRPVLLDKLLGRLLGQETEGLFIYSIVIVDNDESRSAEALVRYYQQKELVDIFYYNEPRQNISLARNMAVLNAKGEFIAFIDDDEFPDDKWLLNLYRTLMRTKADGVLGPVKPHFEGQPPRWVTKSRVLDRSSFATGTILFVKDTRTGNVLFRKNVFTGEACPFDPGFGRTGGEDCDFFRRVIERGCTFVWCNEASVNETISPERYKRSYYLKRALLRGVSEAKLPSNRIGIFRSIVACSLYTLILPFLLFASQAMFMRYLIKNCDHIGKLLALCGIYVIRERNF